MPGPGAAHTVKYGNSPGRELTNLVRRSLLAALPDAAQICIARLQATAVNAADLAGLAEAVPPLVSILRYGTARKIPEAAIAALTRTLAVEVIGGAAPASRNLDEEAAERLRAALAAFDASLDLFAEESLIENWCRTLAVLASDAMATPTVAGLAARRLYERAAATPEATATTLARALSPANPPKAAGGFLDGFVGQSAEVILHDTTLFKIVNEWLASPEEADFLEALPMLRRAFSGFGAIERRRLLDQVGRDAPLPSAVATAIDEQAFAKALPLLKLILGIDDNDASE
jgi:hypothetical protein